MFFQSSEDIESPGSWFTGNRFASNRGAIMSGVRLGQYLAERLQDLVLENPDVQDFLQELAVFSAGFIRKATGQPILCTVTLVRERRPMTGAGSCPDGERLAEIQESAGQSPSLAALESGVTVSVPDTTCDTRWPHYSQAARRAGCHSVLAVPLVLDTGAGATVTFLAAEANAFAGQARNICEAFAGRAGKAARQAVRLSASQDLNEDLREAMKSRTSINLASGILMGQGRCSQKEAFAILSRVSSNRNLKLRAVAEELLRNFDTVAGSTHFDG